MKALKKILLVIVLYFRNRHASQVTMLLVQVRCNFEPYLFDLDDKQSNFRQRTGNRDRREL